ncbi:helix-turn-helix transcriptional regulator [Frankia sp. Cj5]|uniref:helix-turn-helix domain-containing protein n=1 Tax=Frankia sp. Cj5 TaxID=2880978 RepID=UPI001EF55C22|nr:helix-turn-helix transcriptional regulator [Frankia sp. Cj5]
MTVQPDRGPVALRILLGGQLRRLRESRGISREAAGYEIRGSESKISRLELGRVGFKERDIEDLLTFYGIIDEAGRAPMLALAREANQPGWWHRFADILPDWFESYLGLETAATLIRTYEVQFIPGLLQTEDYARSVIIQSNAPGTVSAKDIERRVDMRMSRQKVLDRPNPPRLWAVLDEAALRRPIGTPAVMRTQLERLIAVSERPNLAIQVMPFAFGGHVAESGAFSVLRFAEPNLPDIIYLEHLTGAVYLDKVADVSRYAEAMNRLSVDSLPPDKSAERLARIIAET